MALLVSHPMLNKNREEPEAFQIEPPKEKRGHFCWAGGRPKVVKHILEYISNTM